MPRTTLDFDGLILQEVKALQKKEGRSMGRVVSELLAEALAMRRQPPDPPKLVWTARPMRARVDLADKEAVDALLIPGRNGQRVTIADGL